MRHTPRTLAAADAAFLSLHLARALTEARIPYSERRGSTVYFNADTTLSVSADLTFTTEGSVPAEALPLVRAVFERRAREREDWAALRAEIGWAR